ncbi:MAG: asparagine synthase (glutamine-hydrolyzing), partial [Oscillospiraceae bacterium]|nr:asparagine synthase (glutamine-hydrolyzing) [Candidatus Equicaccousia limihippi]
YDFKELRAQLLAAGHTFKTQGDSEVLVHGYEEWGQELVKKLRGMFSFVIYDQNKDEFFGARDMFGIKPLYYALFDGLFLFGSEIKAFLYHPGFKKTLNKKVLEHYLSFQYSPLEETFFENVFKLPPAHSFVYKNGVMKLNRYWRPDFAAGEGDFDFFADKIEEVMKESVKAHKIADVEVGSFLSSGIDSSYIACLAQVDKTFTVGFGNGTKYNEISYAKEFSKVINVENISKEITGEEYFDNFGNIQYHMDEPLADPAAIALYFVSKVASENVKVVLSGEGADELFGGYKVYREPLTATKYNKIPLPIRYVIGTVASWLPAKRGLNFLVRRKAHLSDWFIGNANIFSLKERKKILKQSTQKGASSVCKRFYDEAANLDNVTKMQYLDINMWLMGDILLKADKTSMANSLELRVPFLDREVMKVAQTVPTKYRVDTVNTKKALRSAAARSIPEFTANKEKLGFPVPIREWIKEDKYYDLIKTAFLSKPAEEFFKCDRLVKMLDDHRAGKSDLSRKIWTVYTFLVWYDEFFVKR